MSGFRSALGGKLWRLSRSVLASQARPDDAWALAQLSAPEARLYASLDARDREHAVRVAQALQAACPSASCELLAAAVLHDAGKSLRPYRLHERVLAGLVPWKLSGYLPFAASQLRAQHPQLGALLLRRLGGRERVAQLIERHHAPGNDVQAALLHRFDELE